MLLPTIQNVLSVASLLATATASKMFIGTYVGSIISADLDASGTIKTISTNGESAPNPSWQEVSPDGKFLYTIVESYKGDYTKGGLNSYRISDTGELRYVATAIGLAAPVHLSISPKDQSVIFTASYGGGASAFKNNPETGGLAFLQSWKYNMTAPGPVEGRQNEPHPHQAMFDPTGEFVVIPDLGADKLRIIGVQGETFTPQPDVDVIPGSGPRHGVFVTGADGKGKFYYLVNELNNSVSVFTVTYGNSTISLTEVQTAFTLPEPSRTVGRNPNTTPSAAAFAFTKDMNVLYVSNRNDVVFNSTDSIAAFNVDKETGLLKLLDYFNSGVVTARHITVDPTGEFFIAEGQNSNNVKVFKIDQGTGKLGVQPVSVFTAEQPVCVSWGKPAGVY